MFPHKAAFFFSSEFLLGMQKFLLRDSSFLKITLHSDMDSAAHVLISVIGAARSSRSNSWHDVEFAVEEPLRRWIRFITGPNAPLNTWLAQSPASPKNGWEILTCVLGPKWLRIETPIFDVRFSTIDCWFSNFALRLLILDFRFVCAHIAIPDYCFGLPLFSDVRCFGVRA